MAADPLYVTRGRADDAAPNLLLVHAMGADHRMWDDLRLLLEPQVRCIAPDLRDAGLSPKAAAPVTIEASADDLAEVIRAEAVAPVAVLGCAIGAMVAVALAGRHPDLVSRLILANPGHFTRPGARTALALRAESARRSGMEAVAAASLEAAWQGCAKDDAYAAHQARFIAQDALAYARQIEAILDADTRPWLDALHCPVLLVAAGQDRLLPPDHAEALKAALPQARLTVLAEGGHFLPLQCPEKLAELVRAELAERP